MKIFNTVNIIISEHLKNQIYKLRFFLYLVITSSIFV